MARQGTREAWQRIKIKSNQEDCLRIPRPNLKFSDKYGAEVRGDLAKN